MINIGRKYEVIKSEGKYEKQFYHVFSGVKWRYIDKTGKEPIPFEYEKAGKFSEGKSGIAISENGITKEGYIDKSGKFIAPPVAHILISYTYKMDAENGQKLALILTLETKGDEKNIAGYQINISRGNMSGYEEKNSFPIKIEADDSFSSSKFGGSKLSRAVKSDKIDCIFTKTDCQRYTLSLYPEQSR